MKKEIIRLRNAEIRGSLSLHHISFCLFEGETAGIYGMHGAGKTSLLKYFLGENKLESGELFVNGTRRNVMDPNLQFAYISGVAQYLPQITVWEHIMVLRKHKGLDHIRKKILRSEVAELLEEYHIDIDPIQKLEELDGFLRFMLEILKQYVFGRKVFLLDDYIYDSDNPHFSVFAQMIRKMCRQGASFLIAGVNANILSKLCGRIMMLSNRTIVKEYPADWRGIKNLRNTLAGQVVRWPKPLQKNETFGESETAFSFRLAGMDLHEEAILRLYKGELAILVNLSLSVTDGMKKRAEQEQGCVVMLDVGIDDYIIDDMSVMDNLCMGQYEKMSVWGKIIRKNLGVAGEEFEQWCGLKGLAARKNCRDLTHLERLAVILYRICMKNPDVLICMDQNHSLDYESKAFVEARFREMTENGMAVCIIVSNVDFLENGADRYHVISESGFFENIPFEQIGKVLKWD